MSENDEKFEAVDSGASDFYPTDVGSVKAGQYVVIQNRPCKVVHVDHFKVGKHGSAKANITGIDIFNEKKMLVNLPCSASINVPYIKRTPYTVINVDEEGFLSLMDKQGSLKQDLKLPDETENDKVLVGWRYLVFWVLVKISVLGFFEKDWNELSKLVFVLDFRIFTNLIFLLFKGNILIFELIYFLL